MRTSIVKAYAVGCMTGSFLTAGIIMLAAPAKADTDPVAYAYAAQYGSAVCQTLDEYPSEAGILGVGEAIIEDGLTSFQAGEVVYHSVSEICPQHLGLVLNWARQETTA